VAGLASIGVEGRTTFEMHKIGMDAFVLDVEAHESDVWVSRAGSENHF
jgi:hypothetical protein